MSTTNMKTIIANDLRVIAAGVALGASLSPEDINILKHKAPLIMFKIKENAKKKNALNDLSKEEKRILMAYVICIRQNTSTGEGDRPNIEDTARILKGDIYPIGSKDGEKSLEKELKKQLGKIGLVIG